MSKQPGRSSEDGTAALGLLCCALTSGFLLLPIEVRVRELGATPRTLLSVQGTRRELPQADEIAGRVAHPRDVDVALRGRRGHHLAARGGCARHRRVDLLDVEVADEALLALRGAWTEPADQEPVPIGEAKPVAAFLVAMEKRTTNAISTCTNGVYHNDDSGDSIGTGAMNLPESAAANGGSRSGKSVLVLGAW